MSTIHSNPLFRSLVTAGADQGLDALTDELNEAGAAALTPEQAEAVRLALLLSAGMALRSLSMSPCDPAAFLKVLEADTVAGFGDGIGFEMAAPIAEHGAALIARERLRQMQGEGYTAEHDDAHRDGSLATAAACYADTAATQARSGRSTLPPCFIHKDWPWEKQDWKPSNDPLKNIIRAGALLAAEADRLLRQKGGGE